jgi:DNA repair photolyase
VRWDNLSASKDEEQRRLPNLDAAVIRTFDAPEALDVRFHEIHARSALNRVPPSSRMPFRWTINPYRGCQHSCLYCAHGSTPILMGDGRTKKLADIRVGDEIYGTVLEGAYRRYVKTDVQAHWSTLKRAYRVKLEDGAELIVSGDHRFWTWRQRWKFVTGAEQGVWQRPHLTLNDHLLGTGKFSEAPDDVPDYRRGYLTGLIRGDGHLGSYLYKRADRPSETIHSFRLALTDLEALRRAHLYLLALNVKTKEFPFAAAVGAHRALTGIRTGARDKVAAIRELVEWPRDSTLDWVKGFLAGIFDAEGSFSGSLRIPNTDPEIIDWTTYCLRRLGLKYVVEDYDRPNGIRCVRLIGGLSQVLRFFHSVDPAITRKRSIEGTALKSDVPLGVESIEPLGVDLPMYDITTGTGDYIANGVVSHNCFARPTHTYLDLDAGRDFEREIVVKVNAPEVLRTELGRPSWKREHVALGTNTDPYQWVESKYKLMPDIWEALLASRTPCSVLTKSPLLTRDIDVMRRLAKEVGFTANVSVPSLDEKAWRSMEPHTPHPRARLEAIAELSKAGIPTGVLVAPLGPGVNDAPEQVEPILDLAEEAGAGHVAGIALHLRGEVRDIWFDWLRANRPDLIPRYERLYARGAYAPPGERKRLQELASRPSLEREGPRMNETGHQPAPPPASAQDSLF